VFPIRLAAARPEQRFGLAPEPAQVNAAHTIPAPRVVRIVARDRA